LQSVGQIIGEVLKQLDDERCMSKPALFPQMESSPNLYLSKLTPCFCSHRESLIRPALRGRLSVKGRQVKAETIYSRRSRYDDSDHNAYVTSRSRSARVQHVS
jgi:hypothetical protein